MLTPLGLPLPLVRNPALVEALRLQGRKVLVDKGDGGQGEGIPQRGTSPNRSARRALARGGPGGVVQGDIPSSSPRVSRSRGGLREVAPEDEFEPTVKGRGTISSSSGGSAGGGDASDWYSQLEAAGFAVRSSSSGAGGGGAAGGERFLERTVSSGVRRRRSQGSSGSLGRQAEADGEDGEEEEDEEDGDTDVPMGVQLSPEGGLQGVYGCERCGSVHTITKCTHLTIV